MIVLREPSYMARLAALEAEMFGACITCGERPEYPGDPYCKHTERVGLARRGNRTYACQHCCADYHELPMNHDQRGYSICRSCREARNRNHSLREAK